MTKQTTMEEQLFKQCISKIEENYRKLRHKIGWRFVTCPKANFNANQEIALITLKPGGNKDDYPQHPRESQELGSAYIEEDWGEGRGNNKLQKQVRAMFKELAKYRKQRENGDDLLSQCLSAHFIPFRSKNIEELNNKEDSERFATALWSNVLTTIQPKLIITLGIGVFEPLSKILQKNAGKEPLIKKPCIGWDDYKARIQKFDKTILWGVPHLSRFAIFNRLESEPYIKEIMQEIT